MHELTVALGIIDGIREYAVRDGFERVHAVHVRVGVMSGITPDVLRLTWELASAGTVAADSTLEIERVPLAIFCEYCEAERAPRPGTGFLCPDCGTPSAKIVHGREMQLVALEIFE